MENTNCDDDQVRAADRGQRGQEERKTDFKARWRVGKVLKKNRKCVEDT